MWRHGDVLIASIEAMPDGAKAAKSKSVLAWGEITGHSHRIEDPKTAELYERNGQIFIRVVADEARVVHEEHAPIALPRGEYKVWFQREYSPEAIRRVVD